MTMRFKEMYCASKHLTCGYTNGVINFTHRQYELRSGADHSKYDGLRTDLLHNGMRNPLITFDDHVLIGQRRFEILRDLVPWFPCLEITDDMSKWGHSQVMNLIKTVDRIYRDRNRDKSLKILIPPSWNFDCGDIKSSAPDFEKQLELNFG